MKRSPSRRNSRARSSAQVESLDVRTLFAAINPTIIDIFVGYSTASRVEVGTQAQMVDKINRAVSFLNQAMLNSKVNVAARLVGTLESNYTESGSGQTDINRLADPADGQLDDVHAAAVAAGADVIDLVVKDTDVGGISRGGYNVILLQFLDNGVFNHEFGHSLGGGHSHGPDEDGKHLVPDSYEGVMNFNGTLVAGPIDGVLPYYSNPNVIFRGQPTGVAGTGATAANNARVMNSNAASLAAIRAPVVVDSAGPTVRLGTLRTTNGQNVINFDVRFGDGSGVNVDSLGDGNIVVTGPNGFSAPAKLVRVDDPSVNHAYHIATYQVTTAAPVTDLKAYTFTLQANQVADTAGNFTPAGKLNASSTPLLPIYADTAVGMSSEEGDLTGKTVLITNEIGKKYQGSFPGNPKYRFSLSAPTTMTVTSSTPSVYRLFLYRDTNFNLELEPTERIEPTAAGIYANLPAGENYYIDTNIYAGGPEFEDYQISASFQSPGSVQIPMSSISGTVFTDTNDNGAQDAGEPGTPNIPVALTGKNDLGQDVNITVNTSNDGVFQFTGLRPSDPQHYWLTEKLPSSIKPGKSGAGTLGGTAFPEGVVRYVPVGPGVTGTGYTFGNAAATPNVSISGSVYFDANDDGVRDANEQGLPNVVVTLKSHSQGGLNVELKTDNNGNYSFPDVPVGLYFIRETQPADVLDGKLTAGSLGGNTGLENWIQLIQVNGVAGTGYLFGERSLPANPPAPPTTTNQTNTTPQSTPTGGNVITTPSDIKPVFDFSNGFGAAGAKVKYNGNASLNAGVAQVMPQRSNAVGSVFYSTPVGISKFTTQFSFNTTAGGGTGDGLAFVIQNNDASALGAGGGGLGYGNIDNSIAIKFDLYNNSNNGNEGSNSTGLCINGVLTPNSIDLTPSGIDLHNGNTLQVKVAYDGTTLVVTITDPTTGKTATQNYTIDLPDTVFGNTAYVGFTAGSGGATAAVNISGWTYAAQAVEAAAPLARAAALPFARAAALQGSVVYAELAPGGAPKHAQSFTLNRDGSYDYTPESGFVGTDTFTYQVVDKNGRTAQATVSLIVTHVNQVPKVETEYVHTTYVDQGKSIDLDLSDQIKDLESSSLHFTISKVVGGTAKLLSDGHTVRFTASSSFVGNALITFCAGDGLAFSYITTSVCVLDVPQKPVAKNDSAGTLPSTVVKINALKNDLDPDNAHLCIQSVAKPANGSAYIDTRGTSNPADDLIVYRPNFGFHGTDTFKYTIIDFYGAPSTASISVTVNPGAGLGVDPVDSSKTALDIFGTKGNDTISIYNAGNKVGVKLNGTVLGTFSPTGSVAAFGGDGNDTITASGVSRTVGLFGDGGNDKLTGGIGKTLLVGGSGSDKLYSGNGRTAFITGVVDYASKGFDPLVRIERGETPSLAGYAHDDRVFDEVFAGTGKDTFWATVTGSGVFDKLNGRVTGELVIGLI